VQLAVDAEQTRQPEQPRGASLLRLNLATQSVGFQPIPAITLGALGSAQIRRPSAVHSRGL